MISLPWLASMLPLTPLSIGAALAQVALPHRKRVLVRAEMDRDDKPFKFVDATFQVKVSGKDNEDRFVIFDTLRTQKVGPPFHLHLDCDEWFYVRDGKFKFKVGDEILHLEAGDSLLVPRQIPHAFVKTSEGTARLIVMHQPAGTMEEYFRIASQFPDQSPEARRKFAEKHNIRFVGPALTPD